MSFSSVLRAGRRLAPLVLLAARLVQADPLSKRLEVDFYRDVSSRDLQGLATRSDGRLVGGPVLTELDGAPPADLLWCLAPGGAADRWLVGSGPDGKIFDVTVDAAAHTAAWREFAALGEAHVFALLRRPDGTVLAGTSPKGALYLLRDGRPVARASLPVDSLFDLLALDDHTALVATGNPGRLYRIDLPRFASGGISADRLSDPKLLADHGITLFGEVRDRNLRRVVRLPDGRILAGSAPRGSVYAFPAAGGAPSILQENRDAEVTDLLPQPNGDVFALMVFSGSPGEARINRPKGASPAGAGADAAAPPSLDLSGPPDKFAGRSVLVRLPAHGFPETLVSRNNLAFYRLLRRGDLLLIAGGESGDMLGYDLPGRASLTFAGSASAQLNGLAAVPGAPGRYLVLKNNAPGLALLDFSADAPRAAETRRLDLGVPATLGATRFNRLRNLASADLGVALNTSFGSDETEGWSGWKPLADADGGWSAADLRGRYFKLRVQLPARAAAAELGKASVFYLPQDRRPVLTDFRVVAPNYALIPASEQPPSPVVSLSQLLGRSGSSGDSADDRRHSAFLASQVVPQTGSQIVLWTLSDADGDNLVSTFSIRHDGDDAWTDLAVNSHDSYAQFDTSHLREGYYFTRLTVTEDEPRPAADRLQTTFETDDLVVDRTPPAIVDATAVRTADTLRVTVHGHDALSLLDGADFNFNDGVRETVEQPADGILDGREETFVLEIPFARVADATAVEVILYDDAGNTSARRLTW